ncbi:MAG: ABC transporter substrate-binding protein [Christensenellaceae bacterium]|nr:ABC transporter substrate-binding protein [Christensenellaceae bacterium]
MFKKLIILMLTAFLLFNNVSSFAEEPTVKLVGLTGPTSMGMAGLLDQNEKGNTKNNYEFEALGTADEVVAKLSSGEADIAAIPLNLAATLYNKTEGKLLKMIDVNTLGVLYVVENGETVTDLSSLKGKDVYSTGKGTVPEYAFRYILSQNGIDPDNDLNIIFKSEATEVVAIMQNTKDVIALLPQPFVTIAQGQVDGLRIVANLTEEWDKLNNGSSFVTGVTVVRSSFAESNPDAVSDFLFDHKASVEFVNANNEEAAKIIEKFGIFKAAVAQKALPYCNITYIDGEDMQNITSAYLQVLFDANPKSIGGSMPDEAFYAKIQK